MRVLIGTLFVAALVCLTPLAAAGRSLGNGPSPAEKPPESIPIPMVQPVQQPRTVAPSTPRVAPPRVILPPTDVPLLAAWDAEAIALQHWLMTSGEDVDPSIEIRSVRTVAVGSRFQVTLARFDRDTGRWLFDCATYTIDGRTGSIQNVHDLRSRFPDWRERRREKD